jgi:sulfatase maturation enzyme AslB (radical SAM superfamily)
MIAKTNLEFRYFTTYPQPAIEYLEKLFEILSSPSNPLTPLMRKHKTRCLEKVPTEVNIETISICNARCIMCPIDRLTRPKRAMDLHLFKKIIDDCLAAGVKNIKLHNYGEPLLTPQFDLMLHYIRERSAHVNVQFATNGSLLDDRWARILIRERVNLNPA